MHPQPVRFRRCAALLVPLLAVGLAGCFPAPPPTGPTGYLATLAPNGKVAGALPLGTTNYAFPVGARFVAITGSDTATGTQASPWRTVGAAVAKSASGTTIVMRAGDYVENVEIPDYKTLTLQSYPGEVAWFTGSAPVTGWVADGGDWRKDNWTVRFSHEGLNAALIDPNHPMAGHPDMAFVDDAPLAQVGSRAEVVPGSFFVDEASSQLWIGTDPTDRNVEATVLPEGLNVKSSGSVVRGIGFKHYGSHISRNGAVKASGNGVLFENNVFEHNAAAGLSVTGDDVIVRRNTTRNNGQVGMHGNTATRLLFEQNLLTFNNSERFWPASAAGGMKITASTDVVLTSNVVEDSWGHGLWLDLHSDRATIVHNAARRNLIAAGIMFEYSDGALIAGNVSTDNDAGIQAGESSNVELWNNTMVNNVYSLKFYDGWREPVPVGFLTRNNVMSARALSIRPMMISEDIALVRSWSDMGWDSDYNAYYRRSSTATEYVGVLNNWPVGKLHFKTVGAMVSSINQDGRSLSVSNVATDPFVTDVGTGRYYLPDNSPAKGQGAPLPIRVADVLGVAAGVPVDIGVLPPL